MDMTYTASCLVFKPIPMPICVERLIEPMLHKILKLAGKIPICNVWAVNHSLASLGSGW